MFKQANVGSADRIIRLIVGAVLVLLPYVVSGGILDAGWMRWVVQIVGLILVLTALVRFCPAYKMLGMNTCKS